MPQEVNQHSNDVNDPAGRPKCLATVLSGSQLSLSGTTQAACAGLVASAGYQNTGFAAKLYGGFTYIVHLELGTLWL